MKQLLLLGLLILGSVSLWSQKSAVTLSGGYAFSNVEESDTDASGWRINASYEYQPMGGKWVHGFSIGYVNTSAESEGNEYVISNLPMYYAPKYMLGNGTLKGFIKGALGLQFATFDRTGVLVAVESSDAGFYGGLGAGAMKLINDKIIINLEYEWAYASNSYYRDGFLNSIMLGVGIKL